MNNRNEGGRQAGGRTRPYSQGPGADKRKEGWSRSGGGGGNKRNAEPSKSVAPAARVSTVREREDEGYADEAVVVRGGSDDEEMIAGKHPVLEAMKAGRALNKIFLFNQAQKHLIQPIMEEAKARGIVVQMVDKRKLDQLAPDMQHQGVVAQAAPIAYAEVEDLLALAAERGEPPFIVLLDEIEDPHNLGSILRTADCTGVHGVIVPKRRSAGLTAVVAKTSAGAVEYVRVARVSNLVQTMEKLKEAGLWIAGADAGAPQSFHQTKLTGPIAIVIGSEGKGLSRLVREKCDFILSLPMFGNVNSLNASVAAGVILYEVVRQRHAQA